MSKLLPLALYKKMYLLREAEKAIQVEYSNNEMKTPMHMSMGNEAIAVGVCAALGKKARVWGTYRSHAIYLARTGNINGFFAELYGKATGPSGGKAGSMHLADPDNGVMMTSAVVGTNIPPALGGAFSSQVLNDGKINVTFFGDGAVDEGVFWESINLASLWRLPVIFVYEDNGLAIHTPTAMRHGYVKVTDIVRQYKCHCLEYDGTDVERICDLTESAVKLIEYGYGPVFMSLKYCRYLEHVGVNEDFDAGYRDKNEFLEWQKKDPVEIQRQRLIDAGPIDTVTEAEDEVTAQIKSAIALAKAAPYPEPEALYKGVYDER